MRYHVELTRTIRFEADVNADDRDAAIDRVIMQAPGDPEDWSITFAEPVATEETSLTDDTNSGFKILD